MKLFTTRTARLLLLWTLVDLHLGTGCEIFDCSIARPMERHPVNPNCTLRLFDKVGMYPAATQNHPPTGTGSLGAFLDVSDSVVQPSECLALAASLTLTVNMTQTFSLNLVCNGGTFQFHSRAFLPLDDGCLRPYPDIDPRQCSFFRQERLRITNHADGLTLANLDGAGRLIAQRRFTLGNASSGKAQMCDCRMFEKLMKIYDDCLTTYGDRVPKNLLEKYVAFGMMLGLLLTFVTAIVVLTSSKVQ